MIYVEYQDNKVTAGNIYEAIDKIFRNAKTPWSVNSVNSVDDSETNQLLDILNGIRGSCRAKIKMFEGNNILAEGVVTVTR